MKTSVRGPLGIVRVFTVAGVLVLAVAASGAAQTSAPGIAVRGNQFVTTSAGTLGVKSVGANVPVVLRGVNITGSEYECLQGDSVWDTIPSAETTAAYQTVVNAMLAWHASHAPCLSTP